jgi:hypothetical protein
MVRCPGLALAGRFLNLNAELRVEPLTQTRSGMKFPAKFARLAKGAAPLDRCEQVARTGAAADPPQGPVIFPAILADSGRGTANDRARITP